MDEFECDCCGATVPVEQVGSVTAFGLETAACMTCRGYTAEEIRERSEES